MNWHARYLQQAAWTHNLRLYLFDKAGLGRARRVLEVGCGTGAILAGLKVKAALHGLDLAREALTECRTHAPNALLTRGDALSLPYPDQFFDLTYCHFLLLWVRDPQQALREMQRVTRARGHILALAEPDYTAREDRPAELAVLGQWQTESLRRQGADPALGARLADLFFRTGIKIIETEAIQSRNVNEMSEQDWQDEWAVLEADVAGMIPAPQIQNMKRLDEAARARHQRRLNVPTYFAWGQV